MEIKSECQLLKPVSLAVNLTRNLSASWYHGHPDVELHGRLKDFSVCTLYLLVFTDASIVTTMTCCCFCSLLLFSQHYFCLWQVYG